MNLVKQSSLRQIKDIVCELATCTALLCDCSNEVNTSIFVEIVDILEDPCEPIFIRDFSQYTASNHRILKKLFCLSQQDN